MVKSPPTTQDAPARLLSADVIVIQNRNLNVLCPAHRRLSESENRVNEAIKTKKQTFRRTNVKQLCKRV